ncbi:LamG-like jellyroll fold domain-containing protein [Anaerospora hongkongensis]|uniref:LamG-like jellyroll fold domain-containing protein n=1 Tax=Anaerospora hongkongensis TaxID=244830 RepID=UPI0028977258|nr:LamG-like jellyroll fold domain-containing protein [Anaerospora hongkongensis]
MPLITGVREESYLLMNFDDVASINGNIPGIVVNKNNATIDTSLQKTGTGALSLSNTYIQLDTKAELFNFGINDFTIALWVRPTVDMSNKELLVLSLNSATGVPGLGLCNGSVRSSNLYMSANGISNNIAQDMGPPLTRGTYTHVALCRAGRYIKAFMSGVNTLTLDVGDSSPIYFNKSNPSYLGVGRNKQYAMSGTIDEFLVINGKALYTETFTPPEDAYVVEATPYLEVTGYEFASTESCERSAIKPSYETGCLDSLGSLTRATKQVIRVEQLVGVGSLTRKIKPVIRVEQLLGVGPRVNGARVLNNEIVMDMAADTIRSSNKDGVTVLEEHQADRIASNREAVELPVFDFDTNISNDFNLLVTPTHQHKEQVVHVKGSARGIAEVLGKYKVSIGSTVIIPYSEITADIRTVEFDINPSDLLPGVNNCKIEYQLPSGLGYLSFKVTKEALKRELVERTFLSYDGGYKTEDVAFSGIARSLPFIHEQEYTTSTLGSGRKFTIKLGNYVKKVEVL